MQIVNKDDRFKFLLNRIYKDNVVIDLRSKDSSLYTEIRLYCKEIKIPMNDYLISIGFEYRRKKKKEKYTKEQLMKQIELLFPEKILNSISDISEKDNNIYQYLRRVAIQENKDIRSLLLEYGYIITYADKELLYKSKLIFRHG